MYILISPLSVPVPVTRKWFLDGLLMICLTSNVFLSFQLWTQKQQSTQDASFNFSEPLTKWYFGCLEFNLAYQSEIATHMEALE